MEPYIKLALVSLIPAAVSMLIYLADTKTPFGKLNNTAKQIIIGIIFGAIAVYGTERGVPMNGAQMNCRDSAVLAAGLLFGTPAGIIAGLIGGIERWFSVYWGIGAFTRVACTVSTIIAGIYSGLLRKYMFDDKKPGVLISLAIGVVMEVFHITMVFITNMNTPIQAMETVRVCTVPLVAANSISLMLSALLINLLSMDRKSNVRKNKIRISQTIQAWMLIAVVIAFGLTSFFIYRLQDTIAETQADSLLTQAIDEVAADILDTSDQNMLVLSRKIAAEANKDNLFSLKNKYDVTEINLIDSNGIIFATTEPMFQDYDMSSGEQSAEFMHLLGSTNEYVQSYGPVSFHSSILRKYAGIKTEYGFVQVGYDAALLQDDISSHVEGMTKNRRVGQTGCVLLLDEKLNAVSIPEGFDASPIMEKDKITSDGENTTFTSVFGDETYLCRYRISEGYYIVSMLPESEALQMRNIALYVNTFMEILVFAILFGLIYMLIKIVVVDRIKSINSSLSKITDGDLGVVVNVRSNAEFASLSDDINSTVDTLKRYIDEASARIDKELQFAKDIQSSALPSAFSAFPKRKDFDIYAYMDPAKEVGGDFYDFYLNGQNTLNFLIADVSGKGIPASLFMMRAKTELKGLTESGLPLAEVFTRGNNELCEGNEAGMFVTAWQGSIDLSTGILNYANAGHNPPLVRHSDGKFEYLRTRAGFVLAGMEGVKYKTSEIQLAPGDTVYLYTDGVTEATNSDNALYGEERLLAAANAKDFGTVREMCEYIRKDVDEFVDSAPQFDDITMVAFRYIGQQSLKFDKAAITDIPVITDFVAKKLAEYDCLIRIVNQLNVVIDEVYSNIVKYAYPSAPGPASVEFEVEDDTRKVMLRFKDNGIPYNPLIKDAPDTALAADEKRIGEAGIFIVKKIVDDIKYEYKDEQNILTVIKKI